MKRLPSISIVLLLIVSITGCSSKIDLNQEKQQIESVAIDLIKNNYRADNGGMLQELLEDSIRVYDVLQLDGNVYLLYSHSFKILEDRHETDQKNIEHMKSQEYYFMDLNVIEKDNSAIRCKLMGGGGGGNKPNTPITIHGTGNYVYGLAQDPRITTIIAEYKDGTIITINTVNKEY